MTRLICLLLLIPLTSHAQTFGGIGFADIAEFAVKTRQAKQCIKRIEPAQLQQLKNQLNNIKKKTDALCKQAKLNEAQQHAIGFAKTLKHDKQLAKIPECTQLLKPTITGAKPIIDFANNDSIYHICSF